jgi:deoxyribonuclease V
MKTKLRARWNVTPREAIRLQQTWRARVESRDRFGPLQYVAGADMAFDPETNVAFASVIVYRLPGLEEVERRMARRLLRFPYVPGLLSFREGPVLLAAFARLRIEPDVILIDGHGVAHPRRLGIACHLGLLLDKPTIGCAKSILVGEAEEPGARAGSTSPLVDHGETVGMALRTRDRVRPIYVTVGHRVALESAVRIVCQCTDGFRIPKPTREADHWVGELRRGYQAGLLEAGSQKQVKRQIAKGKSEKPHLLNVLQTGQLSRALN